MPLQLPILLLLVVIGLCQIVHNFRIPVGLVELTGTHTAKTVSIGVIRQGMAMPLGKRTLIVMDGLAAPGRILVTIFVPLGVCLIDY